MPRVRLSFRERKVLTTTERDARLMRANADSHGSIQPRVKSKRVCGWLDKAVKRGHFTMVQSIKGKKYQITYRAHTHFKTNNLIVNISRNEMIGKGKLGKGISGKMYSKKNGVWVEVNVRW